MGYRYFYHNTSLMSNRELRIYLLAVKILKPEINCKVTQGDIEMRDRCNTHILLAESTEDEAILWVAKQEDLEKLHSPAQQLNLQTFTENL